MSECTKGIPIIAAAVEAVRGADDRRADTGIELVSTRRKHLYNWSKKCDSVALNSQ
jgi:hypothetical protein